MYCMTFVAWPTDPIGLGSMVVMLSEVYEVWRSEQIGLRGMLLL